MSSDSDSHSSNSDKQVVIDISSDSDVHDSDNESDVQDSDYADFDDEYDEDFDSYEINEPVIPEKFEKTFICIPFSRHKNPSLERGDKIIMPESALSEIVSSKIKTPWLFQIRTSDSNPVSHCGVLQFNAEEGFVHLPDWMMQNLKINEGDLVTLHDVDVSTGTFIKLQPHETDFTKISNPKAVLEKRLSDFSCLSSGDTFVVSYNGRDYLINVLEVRPGPNVINLIDTDCEVEFVQPLDYKQPEIIKKKLGFNSKKNPEEKVVKMEEEKKFEAFSGKPMRLDGKESVEAGVSAMIIDQEVEKKRKLPTTSDHEQKDEKKFKAFSGRSNVLGNS